MIYIILLFLVLCKCYGVVQVPNELNIAILFFLWYKGYKKYSIYKKSFNLIFIGLVCSTLSCWFYRGQTPFESFEGLFYYYGILFYFFLKWKEFSLKEVEKALIVLVLTFDILYIVQFHLIDYGINFINFQDWMLNDQAVGGNRLRVLSSGLYNLGIFLGLVKFNQTKNYAYIVLVLLGFYVLLLSGFRQLLASAVFTLIYYAYKTKNKLSLKQLIMFVALYISMLFIYDLPEVQTKIEGMLLRNENGATLDNEDYVRIRQLNFYLHDFFHDPIEWFFGGGLPYYKSEYGKWANMNYQVADWGLLGQSWALGILTVAGFLMFSFKAIRLKVDREYMYVSLWYIFLLLSSLTNYEFMRNGNFLVHSIALYIVELAAKNNPQKRNKYVVHNNSTI